MALKHGDVLTFEKPGKGRDLGTPEQLRQRARDISHRLRHDSFMRLEKREQLRAELLNIAAILADALQD